MSTGKTYSTKYLLDSNNNRGAEGQVLSTTSTGIDWVDANTVPGTGLWLANGNDIYNSNSGNVGIGVTDPEKRLEVKSDTTYDGIMLDVLSAPEITFRDRGNSDTRVGTGRHALDGFHIDTYSGNAVLIKGSNRFVGIGTTGPTAKLHVLGGSNDTIDETTANFKVQGGGGNGTMFGTIASSPFTSYIQSAYVVDTSLAQYNLALNPIGGNVGIGTTGPLTKLHIAGTTDANIIRIENTSTSLSLGSTIGAIQFFNNDPTDNSPNVAASIYATAGASGGSGSLRFKTIEPGVEGDPATEAMIITNGGNVGIGETSPAVPLHISRDSASGENIALLLDNNDTTAGSEIGMLFRCMTGGGNTDFEIFGKANAVNDMDLVFESDGSNERVRFTGDGKVGIGTTNPLYPFSLENSGTGLISRIYNTNADGQGLLIRAGATTSGTRVFQAASSNDTKIMTVNSNGNVGIGTTSPDAILETSKEVDGNQVGALLTNTRQAGTADSVSLNFGLGRTADGYIRSVDAIKLLKEQQWTGTPSTVDAALVFSTVSNETVSERMRIDSAGAIKFNAYDSTNNTGTPTYMLGTDSSGNVVKVLGGDIPGGGGTVTGSGTSTQVAFWNTNTSLSGNSDLWWDSINNRLGIGDSTPSARLKVATSASNTSIYTVDINHVRDDADVGTHAMRINMDLSGADTTTADRLSSGIFIDIDSSANGDSADEHRIYGVNSAVNFTGYSDIVRGGYFLAESNYTGAKTAQLAGVYGYAIHDANDAAGGVSNMYGVYGISSIQDLGDVDNAFGGYFSVTIGDNRLADVGVTKGVEGQIEINKDTAINYGTMIGVSSVIDNNEGAVPNFGDQYLFKGDYQGDKGGNAYGVYVEGDKHYFAGNVGIGVTGPNNLLHIEGSITNAAIQVNQSGSGVVANFKQGGSSKLLIDNSGNVGIGTTSPTSLLEISQQLSAAATIDYPYTISSRDDGNSINQVGGEGVGIKFRIAGNAATTPGNSLVGASIAAIRESASDTDSSTGLGLFVTQNDETLDEALRIDHDGNVGIGTTLPTTALTIRKAISPTAYGEQASMIEFKSYYTGYDTETVKSAIYSGVSSQTSLQTTKGFMSFWTSDEVAGGGESLTEKMRIESDGNVGIGTTSPETPLHVLTNTTDNASTMLIQNGSTGDASIKFNISGDTYSIGIDNSDSDKFKLSYGAVGTNDRIVVDTSGNVGIGVTAPAQKLHVGDGGIRVQKSATGLGGFISVGNATESTGNYSAYFFGNTASGTGYFKGGIAYETLASTYGRGDMHFLQNSTTAVANVTISDSVMTILNGGNVGIGTTSPGAKLEVIGTAATYTNASTVFWGGTTNNDNHNGIMLSSFGDALGGSLASNLLYSNSNTPTQTNTNRSSGQIKFGNTTVASKTSDINFGGYYKGTTTFVERMRIDSDGGVGINTTNPSEKLEVNGNVKVQGDIIVNSDIELGPSSRIQLDDQPTASTASGSGTIVNWSVSDATTAGTLYTVKTNGLWTPVDADNEATSIGMLAIALGSNATAGMLLQGFFYKASHGFTIGLPLYISNTAGAFSTTRPTGTNDYVRIIGYATSANYIYFDPDKTWVQVA